jgi:hypothetical protein
MGLFEDIYRRIKNRKQKQDEKNNKPDTVNRGMFWLGYDPEHPSPHLKNIDDEQTNTEMSNKKGNEEKAKIIKNKQTTSSVQPTVHKPDDIVRSNSDYYADTYTAHKYDYGYDNDEMFPSNPYNQNRDTER